MDRPRSRSMARQLLLRGGLALSELTDRRIDTTMVGQLATQLRADAIRASTATGSGHPTSSMSAADLLAVLVTRHLRYDWDDPALPVNDHLSVS